MKSAKIMINNSAADCSISLKFDKEFDHLTPDLKQTFKVTESKVNVIAWKRCLADRQIIALF